MSAREKLHTIVVATDFSESAEVAIDWAVEVARPHGAKLLLMHALQATHVAERKLCEEALAKRAEKLRSEATSVEGSVVVATEFSAHTIVEAAEGAGADLIVAGSRGQTGLKRVYLGSTAAHLVREATCPVLTVHRESVGQHRPIRHILIPTDYSQDAELALREAARVLGPASGNARVVIVHVYQLPMVYPWSPQPPTHRRSELAHETQRHLEEMAAPLRAAGFDVQVVAQEGHPADVIEAEAIRVGADLIAMGTHGRTGLKRLLFGSVAERVLPSAPCPVLTVHVETSS